jgi:flavin reductase (DIM6/NTAB) family NADH-FMN oxidoreductase RutF
MQASPDKLSTIDAALKLLNRELWIVTAAAGPRRGGLLASWVSVASIDRARPVLIAGLAPNHFTTELVQSNGSFAAHLLRAEQVDLAWIFASASSRTHDKFSGLEVQTHDTGSPVLTDCLAWFDCRVFHRHSTGDRLYFWADVLNGHHNASDEPASALREQDFFRQLTAERRQQLAADRDADAAALRGLHAQWRLENRC